MALAAPELHAQLAVNRVEVVMHTNDFLGRDVVIGVRNESGKSVQAQVRLEDWDRSANGSNQWYPYGTRSGDGNCGKALSIFPQSIRLDAGASQSIRVVLDSAHAPAGECWAAAVVETVEPTERAGQRLNYVLRTAVKIYVMAPGLRADGEIDAVRLVADSGAARGSQGVEVAFANTGTRHVVAEGALEVRRTDNTLVTRVPLPNVYALPGARQFVRVPMPDLPAGSYVFLATMDYGGPDIAAALLEHRKR
jgi:P pilus assembly chaperone PapD